MAFTSISIAAVALASSGVPAGATSASSGAAAQRTATLRFAPVADARVEEANPTSKFGTGTRLGSDGDAGFRVESVLRFDVSGISGTVQSAKLRLYVVADPTQDGPAVYPAGSDWSEAGITWETRPPAAGAAVADIGAAAVGTWVEPDVTSLVLGNGTVSVLLKQSGTDGVQFYSQQGTYKPELVVTAAADPVVMAAGDIACKPGSTVTSTTCRHQYTSDLLLNEPALTNVLALGDTQYEDALYSEFTGAGAYDTTWGRLKSITKPVPGNHEYDTSGAAPGYFDYFGEAAGARGSGYYSFDLGSWHLIALNSEISMSAGSAQETWLRNDLAANPSPCVLAYWHRPRFSSGKHGSSSTPAAVWNVLYNAGADVVLNSHDHDYERFAQQNASGQPDPNGIREFVVGTGGASHYGFGTPLPTSEVRNGNTYGVLKMTLRATGYEWQFLPEAGASFTDFGSGECHDLLPAASLTTSPATGPAPLAVTADASASTDDEGRIASYTFDFGDGSAPVGPQTTPTATHTYTDGGSYTVTVTVTDRAGQSSTATTEVVVKPTSNLGRNSDFETDTSGWNTSGSGTGITLTRTAGGNTSNWAAQLTNTGTAAGTCTLNDSPTWVKTTSAGTYSGTLWVRGETEGATLKLRLREYSGASLVGSATGSVTLTTAWRQVTVTYAIVSPGSTLDYNAYMTNAGPGVCFYADDAALYFRDSPPAASVTASPSSGWAPLAVTADASASSDTDGIASYTFAFGDGSPAVGPKAEPTATHTYATGGTHTITVTVTDTAEQSSTATAQVVVQPNFVRNPNFETSTSGWNTSGSGTDITLTRVSGGHTGDWAAQLANTGAAPSTCTLNDSPNSVTTTSAGTYTGSLWVRADTEGATLRLRLREFEGATLAGSATTEVTLTTSWQQVSVTYEAASPGSSTLDYNASVVNAAPGTCFYADDATMYLD